jgi:hypothetical protein
MLDSNFLIERINSTIRMLGSSSYLEEMGFHNILGYITIVKEINELNFEKVLNILRQLKLKGGIYGAFADHLMNDGVLNDNFFELDDFFNPTINNLKYHLENFENKDFENLKEQYKKENEILNRQFQNIYENKKEKLDLIVTSNLEEKLKSLEKKIGQNILFWLKNDIKTMSNEDFGNIMVLIMKYRNGER